MDSILCGTIKCGHIQYEICGILQTVNNCIGTKCVVETTGYV